MDFQRLAFLVVLLFGGLPYGHGFSKRSTTTDILFVKSSTADWNQKEKDSKKEESTTLTDENPGNGATKRLHFTAFGRDWSVSLKKNTMLIGRDVAVEIRSAQTDAVLQSTPAPRDCFYIGTVEAGENEAGLAAVSTCRNRLTGYMITNLNDYMINPTKREARKRDVTEEDPLDMYRRDMNITRRDVDEVRSRLKRSWHEILFQPLSRPEGQVLYYEAGVIIDMSFTDAFYYQVSTDETELNYYIPSLFNFVQLWYLHRTLGFQIWLTLQKIIIIQQAIPIPGRLPGQAFAEACEWQGKTYKDSGKWDLTFFLTGDKGILGGIGGLANPGSACHEPTIHCAGIWYNHFHQSLLARAIAHEGIHPLGVSDDYSKPFNELCYSGMMREGLYEDRDWSMCTQQLLEQFLELKNVSRCLQNDYTPSLASTTPPRLPSNVAWRSEVRQSTTYHSEKAWGAWKAVDGSITGVPFADPNPVLGSCTRTQRESNPWLVVTLPEKYTSNTITSIHVYNREDCCGDRLHDFEVRVGDDRDFRNNPLCHLYEGAVPGGRYGMAVIKCDRPMSGKYVSIQIKGRREILTVCELMVFQDVQLPDFRTLDIDCADKVYGCPGRKRNGECGNPELHDFMMGYCAYTCGYCRRDVTHPTIRPGTIHPPYSTDEPSCRDENRGCPDVLANGRCHESDNMKRCRRSCLGCKDQTTTPRSTTTTTPTTTTTTPAPPCVDNNPECQSWVNMGHCTVPVVRDTCRKACNNC